MARSSALANSTNIANRMFRTQRYIMFGILSLLVLLLFVTSIAAHQHIKVNHPDVYQKLGDKLTSYGAWPNVESTNESSESPAPTENEDQVYEKKMI